MMQGPIGIIADDLTGANDTGAQFSRRGGAVLVLLSLERSPQGIEEGWDAVVINSGSRNLPPGEARQRMALAIERLEALGVPLLYQKIDSTLRGTWAEELDVALAHRKGAVFLAPAFPLNGRTVEGGILKVHGEPLQLSEAARDELSPVRSGDIVDLLGERLGRASRKIGLETLSKGAETVRMAARHAMSQGARVLVCDARTQSDLAAVAEAALPFLPDALMCGSAGLARELAERMGPDRAAAGMPSPRSSGPVLVVAGSRSRVTVEQVARLIQAERPSHVEIDPGAVDGPWNEPRRAGLAEALVAELRANAGARVWLVTIGEDSAGESARFQQRSERLNSLLGAVAARAFHAQPLSGLVLTGGDVAASVLESLQAIGVRLGAEILPGIPLGAIMGGAHEGLGLVTKAGAFGPPEALREAVGALTGRAISPEAETRRMGKVTS
jgi:uncharacterized protein YgbK (DUF1537 family)